MAKKDKKQVPESPQLEDTYRKTYRMQTVGIDGSTIRTSVPRVIVEREARRHDLTIEKFIEEFRISWLYNGFSGAYATFVRKEKEKATPTK